MDIIRECARKPIIYIDVQATAQEIARLMTEKKISAVLVKSGEDFKGIVTKTDLVTKVIGEGKDPKKILSSEIMAHPLLTMDEFLSRGEAHEFMSRNHIKHLAVTSRGKIAGMVTIRDLVS